MTPCLPCCVGAVGSVIMAVDEDSNWLVTADVDGLVKVWDISQYCLYDNSEDGVVTDPPRKHMQS